ncbi:type I glyceraldehyde-3-phosphate dehydrogenase [Candidatus Bandiella euplotis]|uniref:Type I glyceraldehyde-3-phosphate dehydrogenase n=1 Tax=Candidatus Bandiella euplotis TaxID=1664265 RepID=A0ABZ0UK66_9RICK|nr:type I glyceraldehyde-3-phosphate dehydrogenase [Candidatus Bandiella woodruffii]WPX96052.1 Type I glyceraldehyde-3-phosphate dehydrogenase [Candidatus Bandiella woodruffii]
MRKKNVAINGLGRIGKNLFRRYFEEDYENFNLVAVNLGESNIESKIHLLRHDSVHGHFSGVEKIENDQIFVGSKRVKLLTQRNIESINWEQYGVDVVLECTGNFTNRDKSYQHIKQGARKVLVSAPCKEADKTIVMGVNHQDITSDDEIISVGSCTTNCLAPIAKILDSGVGIESGFMTTIHSYTNDQRIIDGGHTDLRRARAAAVSMIPTTTGAAKSIGLVLPSLKGKLDGAAIRVPTPNVSMIDLSFYASKETSSEEINDIVRKEAKLLYKGIVEVVDEQLVSIDFNHTTASAIFDINETRVLNKRFCRIMAWYDNEWAFSCRMLEVANLITGL